MQTETTSRSLDALRARLSDSADGILESLAAEYGVTLHDVLRSLPPGFAEERDGIHFTAALDSIATWGVVTLVVHTPDAVVEFKGAFPSGSLGRGYFNLKEAGGLSGHLRPERCTRIVFLERPFMGLDTAGVLFMNPDGECMMKIFLTRRDDKALDAEQLAAMHALKAQLA